MRHGTLKRWAFLGVAAVAIAVLAAPAHEPRLLLPGAALLGQINPGPSRLLQRLGTNQLRHGSRILALSYSPSGQLLAAGGGSDPVRIWDAATGQQRYTCNDTWVNAIVFSPRGSILITAGAFKSIRLWEAATGKEAGKLDGHAAPVKALTLSPGGDLLVSGGQDGAIILWEVAFKKKVTELKEHTDEVTSLAYCTGQEIFVSGSNDRTVRVWDADTNKVKLKVDAGCGVLAVAVSPDGKTVYAGGDDNLVRAWDVGTGKLQHTFRGHQDMVVSLALSRDGKTLVSGGRDKAIRVWNLEKPSAEPKVIPRHLGDSDALALTRDGNRVATAGLNNTIRIFETASGKELLAGDGPQAGLNGLALSRDGKTLAAVTGPGILYLWDAAAGKPLRDWSIGKGGETALAFTPDGHSLVTAGDQVRFWDPRTGKERFALPARGSDTPASLVFSPDGKLLAVGYRGGPVVLWDIESKKSTGEFKYPGQPFALAFSDDGSLVAASGGSKIVLYDRTAGKELRQFHCKEAPPKTLLPDVAALAFSPDHKTLAVSCFDGVIRVLDFATGKEISACEGHLSVPYSIAYARDGRTLLSGSFDATARLWEPFSGLPLAELKGHVGPVYGVALAPDGRIGYSASADTTVLVWDATGYGKAGPPKGALGNAELEEAWRGLAGDDAAMSRRLVWRLIANPQGVADFLRTKVHLVDVARINKLLGDLDSENYDERDAAFKELAAQGRWLEGRLEEAKVKPPSLEYKRRIEQLLEKLHVPGSLSLRQEQLRLRRAMMVLEYLADAPSLDLLAKLSKQAPEEAFRQEAQATLQRLGRRG